MTNEMHNSVNNFCPPFFPCSACFERFTRSSSGARHNILYHTVGCNHAGESSCYEVVGKTLSYISLIRWSKNEYISTSNSQYTYSTTNTTLRKSVEWFRSWNMRTDRHDLKKARYLYFVQLTQGGEQLLLEILYYPNRDSSISMARQLKREICQLQRDQNLRFYLLTTPFRLHK